MSKINELIDNLRYYLWWRPVSAYKTVRCWWNTNGKNPWHWKMVWYAMFHHYGWDYEYMFNMLYYQIQKSKWYFENACWVLSKKDIEEKTKYQKLALRMLDIILHEERLYDFVDIPGADENTPFYERTKYVCTVYVNMRTKERFAVKCIDLKTGKTEYSTECFNNMPHELYIEKAKRILYRIMEEHCEEWWD